MKVEGIVDLSVKESFAKDSSMDLFSVGEMKRLQTVAHCRQRLTPKLVLTGHL